MSRPTDGCLERSHIAARRILRFHPKERAGLRYKPVDLFCIASSSNLLADSSKPIFSPMKVIATY